VARLHRAERAEVDLREVLEVGGFDLSRALASRPGFLEPEYPFEWTGLFRLDAGTHAVRLAGGADPAVDLVVVPVDAAALQAEGDGALRAAAERSVRVLGRPDRRGIPALAPDRHLRVPLAGPTEVELLVPEAGLYALSTEHLPEEVGLAVAAAAGPGVAPLVERRWKPGHVHEEEVGAIGLRAPREVDLPRFQAWLGDLLQEQGASIYRAKGVLAVAGSDRRFVFQAVHMLLESSRERAWTPAEARESVAVFIGRSLDEAALRAGFERCLR
jgi:G3E family GTPase